MFLFRYVCKYQKNVRTCQKCVNFKKKCVFAESKAAFVFDIYKNKRRFFRPILSQRYPLHRCPLCFRQQKDSAWFITERKDNKKSMEVTEAFLGNCYVNVIFYLAITNHLRGKIAPFAEIFWLEIRGYLHEATWPSWWRARICKKMYVDLCNSTEPFFRLEFGLFRECRFVAVCGELGMLKISRMGIDFWSYQVR